MDKVKYSNKQYAAALLASFDHASADKQKVVIKNFIALLKRSGVYGKRNEILKEAEKLYFKHKGVHKVDVETAGKPSENLKKEIESALGKNIVLRETVNPEILGGIKILIDDENLIDGSARTQLSKLFQKVNI